MAETLRELVVALSLDSSNFSRNIYDDMILTATCFIADPEKIPVIAAWLKGKGTVTFANRTGGHYNARIANQIPFEKVLRGNPHCSFAVNFRCYPFWYKGRLALYAPQVLGFLAVPRETRLLTKTP